MPLGTRHQLEGLLLRQRGGLVLQTDDGGTWQLEAPSAARRLVGRRVRIDGTKAGFDCLDVSAISLTGQSVPMREPVFGGRGLTGALVALAAVAALIVVMAG